jgi:hypothetical protein
MTTDLTIPPRLRELLMNVTEKQRETYVVEPLELSAITKAKLVVFDTFSL